MGLVSSIVQLLKDPDNIIWPKAHIYDAANQALLWFWVRARHETTTDQVIIPAGALTFQWPNEKIMVPQAIEDGEIEYFVTSLQEINRYLKYYWHEGPSYPKHFAVWDATHLRPFPAPDQTYIFTLRGVTWPPEVSATNEDPDIPHKLEHACMFKAASLLIEDLQPATADVWEQNAVQELNEFKIQTRNVASTTRLYKLTPGTKYQRAQGGAIVIGRKF